MNFKLPDGTPKYLYRYMKIDGRTLRIIRQSEIYFCSPKSLNDPFDCNLHFEWEDTANELADNLTRLVAVESPRIPAQDVAAAAIRQVLTGHSRRTINSVIPAAVSEFQNKIGMLCMSDKNDDILMYSHYSEGHTGICLEYSVTSHDFYDYPFKVEYSELFPRVKFFEFNKEDPEACLRPFLLTKAEQWRYENEWRILKPEGAGIYQFPPEFLTGIVLGCEVTSQDRHKVTKTIKKRGRPTRVYEARKKAGKFALEIVHVDTIG